MKTLNDYIRESILDDEDVLIGGAKDAFNDPFTAVVAAVDSGMDEYELAKFIAGGVFDKFVNDELYLNPKDFYWDIMTFSNSMVSISLCNSKTNVSAIKVRYMRKSRILNFEITKFNSWGIIKDIFEYDKYKKALSNIRKRGFKKSNSLDRNLNVYSKEI